MTSAKKRDSKHEYELLMLLRNAFCVPTRARYVMTVITDNSNAVNDDIWPKNGRETDSERSMMYPVHLLDTPNYEHAHFGMRFDDLCERSIFHELENTISISRRTLDHSFERIPSTFLTRMLNHRFINCLLSTVVRERIEHRTFCFVTRIRSYHRTVCCLFFFFLAF